MTNDRFGPLNRLLVSDAYLAMKTLLLLSTLIAVVLSLATLQSVAADAPVAAPKGKGRGKLVHMVSFKFKDSATPEDIRKVEAAFAALPEKISQIATYETGTNVSPEKLNKGLTHAFLLTFHTAQDRDEYLVHPEHKAFGSLIGPYIADVFVIDFWADKAKTKKAGKKDATKSAK